MSFSISGELAALILVSTYLLGSIPFGLLFARWITGKDPREHGSGNIGATNAMRTGGKKVGILTLLADILKGSLPVAAVAYGLGDQHLSYWVALSAFLGHIFPIYLKFQGGKGVATMFGVLIPIVPWVAILAFAVWLLVFKSTRYVSLASMIAGFLLPFLAWGLAKLQHQPSELSLLMMCSVLGLLMIARHQENIVRLRNGTESKVTSS